MKIIFQIDGGIGKSIVATAVCKAIKAQYPKDELIVITGYPEVFLCNPNMKAFAFNELRYFYEQYVADGNIKLMIQNPYLETDFVKGGKHLIQVWCEMNGIKYNGELPDLILNNREETFYTNMFGQAQKPIMVIQINGGGKEQPNKYSWVRDIPVSTAQKVVDAFKDEYTILHIRREDQLPLKDTIPIQTDFRALAVLINNSAKRLFMDSFTQHAAAALGKPSVVCMIDEYTAAHFGYEMHSTIIANPPTIKPELRYSVFSKYNISGTPTEFPYNNEAEIYDADAIIAALRAEHATIAQAIIPAENNGKSKKKEQLAVSDSQ